jgi:hypothetical protein
MESRATPAQEKNYVSMSCLKEIFEHQRADETVWDIKRRHRNLLVLAISTQLAPKRCDFGDVLLCRKESDVPNDAEANGTNYIVLDRKSPKIVLYQYRKTGLAGTGAHAIVEPLTPVLRSILKESLKKYPRKYLFVGRNGQPYLPKHYAVMFRNAMKDLTGKPMGVSLLRHAFINDSVDLNEMTPAEKLAIAKRMGHSSGMQSMYKLKLRGTD